MRQQLRGIGVYFLAAIVVLASVFIISKPPGKLFYQDADNAFMADFIIYYSAGQIFNKAPDKIYSSEEYRKHYAEITGWPNESFAQYVACILYPPYAVFLYAPFAKMPLMDAYYFWRIISGLLTFLLAYLLIKDTNLRHSPAIFFTYIAAIISPPMLDALNIGQPTILLPLGIIIFKLLARTHYVFFACMILVLTSLKPHLTLAAILYLLINNYGKRELYSLIAASILVFTACSAIFGFDIWQQYLSAITSAPEKMHSFGETELSMANIRTILLLMFGQVNFAAINFISLILWMISVMLSIYAGFTTRKQSQRSKAITFAMVITASCVFGLWTHISSLALLLIPLGCLLKYSSKTTLYIIAIIILSMNLLSGTFLPVSLAVTQLLLLIYFYFMLTKNGDRNDLHTTPAISS